MRRGRMKARNNNKSNKVLFIIALLVLLPVISISIGYLGTQYVIIPKFFSHDTSEKEDTESQNEPANDIESAESSSREEEPKDNEVINDNSNNEAKDYNVDIPPLSIYSVQVGSFSDMSHANVLVNELKNKGLQGYVLKSGGYKVITNSYLDRENAELYKQVIQEHYSDAFILTINIAKRSVLYGEMDKEYGEVINTQLDKLNEFYKGYYSFLINNDLAQLSSENTIQFLDKQIKLLGEIYSATIATKPTKDIVIIKDNIVNITKITKDELEAIKTRGGTTPQELWNIFTQSVNHYIDIT